MFHTQGPLTFSNNFLEGTGETRMETEEWEILKSNIQALEIC